MVDVARQFLGLQELEDSGSLVRPYLKPGPCLELCIYGLRTVIQHAAASADLHAPAALLWQVVHVGDALAGDVGIDGGFAGIIVDIFVEGSVHTNLLEVFSPDCPWRKKTQDMYLACTVYLWCPS